MNFDLTEDQQAIEAALDQLVQRHGELPVGSADYVQTSAALERDLVSGGFRDIARQEGLGSFEAALLIEAAGRIPYAAEVMASSLLAPLVSNEPLDGPVAVAAAPLSRPIRFLAEGGTLLVDTGADVRIVTAPRVEPVPSFYAYPFGRPLSVDLDKAAVAPIAADVFRQYWRLGLAAEIAGAMDAALARTVQYVKDRKQFGQPLGAFQAIQHRLSECAVLVKAVQLLVREAACSADPTAAALACAHAQEAAARLIYDTHQFHGAMGLTLEYPLHYWTYRLRALQGELDGASASAGIAADLLWREGEPVGDPL
jgi:hypothetical protein